jgi:hypothetical protein
MGGPRWTQRQKQTVFRLRAEGVYLKDIAPQLDCELSCVSLVVRLRRSFFGVSDPWTPRAGRLGVDERQRILAGLARGESLSSIARSVSRSPSTVSREVNANGAASATQSGDPITAPETRPDVPSPRNSVTVRYSLRSRSGWANSGHPRRSPSATVWTIPTTPRRA